MPRRKTKEEFIADAIKVHSNKYDYSKVDYKNNHTKVCIICPKHGEFWQLPHGHLDSKQGCPQCNGGVSYDAKEFVERANKIHNNKYDYSKCEYHNASTKVTIICPEHGEFQQKPNIHLSGCGCPICGGHEKITTKSFINKANLIHNNQYDYSKVNYLNCTTKVPIICKLHGEFWQQPIKHIIAKQGCPVCKSSHMEREMSKFLIENNIKFIEQASRKNFEWLGLQSLDFYLPEYNVAIECQGKQHFLRGCNFGSKKEKDQFDVVIKRDEIKLQKCIEHNIEIYYYTDFEMKEYPYEVYRDKGKLLEKVLEKNGKQDRF